MTVAAVDQDLPGPVDRLGPEERIYSQTIIIYLLCNFTNNLLEICPI